MDKPEGETGNCIMGVCSEAGLGVAVIVSRAEGKVSSEVVNLASYVGSAMRVLIWTAISPQQV